MSMTDLHVHTVLPIVRCDELLVSPIVGRPAGNPLSACATLHTLDLPGHLNVASVNSDVAELPSRERLLLYSTLGAERSTKGAQQISCNIRNL